MIDPSLDEVLSDYRNRVESALEESLAGAAVAPRLEEAMRYSLLAGAKRLRPCLVLAACELCERPADAAMPAACAVEMVHTYSLIHDDLPAMDDDDLRRGRPTCHKAFDEATAILAGDGLLTRAFEMLTEIEPAEVAIACIADLASAAGFRGMVGGQMLDLQAETTPVAEAAALRGIHEAKTGALIAASLTIGARIAGADAESLSLLANFGKCVGLAFQIADDLLDIGGDAAKMGKGIRKDADRGKATYPQLLGADPSRREAQELIDQAKQSLRPFGERAAVLSALAEYIIDRDH